MARLDQPALAAMALGARGLEAYPPVGPLPPRPQLHEPRPAPDTLSWPPYGLALTTEHQSPSPSRLQIRGKGTQAGGPHGAAAGGNAGKWRGTFLEARATPAPTAPRRHAGRWAAAIVVALFLALLAYGLASKGTDDRIDRALEKGQAPVAPAFGLEVLQRGQLPAGRAGKIVSRALADGRITLGELRGAPVVLNMWASWCSPCRAESRPLENQWRA